nr:hypothetical protein [Tanacetum cinerariifolium]
MSQKPGHVTPIDYTKLNALYDQFVPQKELSREHVYWLSASDIASQSSDPPKPVTPFVHTRPMNNEVHTKVWKIKECLTPFEEVIKKRNAPPSDVLYHHEYNCIKKCFDEEVIPFFNNIKQLFQLLDHNIYMEVTEFERIFDELDSEYEQTVLTNKNLQIEKKNLLIKNECLNSDSISKDICSIVLASVNIVPPISDCMCAELRTSCDREYNRVFELEAEIYKLHNMLKESEKCCVFIQKDHIDLQNDGYKIKIANHTRRYLELLKASTYSRNTSNEKIAALNAEIAKMKPSGSGTKVARPKTIPKNVRKTDITVAYRIVPQWKPTDRQFILCDIYGPKKSKAPTAKPLELSLSVSSSSPINVISRLSDSQL